MKEVIGQSLRIARKRATAEGPPGLLRRARVLSAEALEPACGSVSTKAPSHSPRAIGFRYFCFRSFVPKARIVAQPTPLWTAITIDSAPLPATISSIAMT